MLVTGLESQGWLWERFDSRYRSWAEPHRCSKNLRTCPVGSLLTLAGSRSGSSWSQATHAVGSFGGVVLPGSTGSDVRLIPYPPCPTGKAVGDAPQVRYGHGATP